MKPSRPESVKLLTISLQHGPKYMQVIWKNSLSVILGDWNKKKANKLTKLDTVKATVI